MDSAGKKQRAENGARRPRTAQREHPRPLMERAAWQSLNGVWDFSIDADGFQMSPPKVAWKQRILVPFSPETAASRIGNTGFYRAVWYRKRVRRCCGR
jgi:hypothetical protein